MPKIKSGKEQLKEALKKKEPEVDETGYYVRRKEPEPKRIYAGTDRGFITQEEVKPSKTRYSVSSPTGGREVSYEEYKNEVEAAKIIAEGGRKSITPEEMEAQELVKQEEERIVAEEYPKQRELKPEERKGENLPVFGGTFMALQNVIAHYINKSPFLQKLGFAGEELQPEELRTAALTEIERQVYEQGISDSEAFGILIEGIPGIGGLVSQYAPGLETPGGDIRTMKTTIRKQKTRGLKMAMWAGMGILDAQNAREQITQIERDIQRLESRIKLLLNYSPSLKSNSDYVNEIEVEILTAKEALLEAKVRAMQGQSKETTDWALAMALGELSE